MLPELTVCVLISADGKIATRSQESLHQFGSDSHHRRRAELAAGADALLLDSTTAHSGPPDGAPDQRVIVIDDEQSSPATAISGNRILLTSTTPIKEQLETLSDQFGIRRIFCCARPALLRKVMKDGLVSTLYLTMTDHVIGGHASNTICGNGAATPFSSSIPLRLVSHTAVVNGSTSELQLVYQSPSMPQQP